MLREEILQHLREVYRSEWLSALAVGAVYTWLIAHRDDPMPHILWYVPSLVVFVGGARCASLCIQIGIVASYLKLIEEEAFGRNVKLPGWERYVSKGKPRMHVIFSNGLAVFVWLIVLGATFYLPTKLSK